MKSMATVWKAATGVLSAAPGLAAIAVGLGAIPGYRLLFGGVLEAAGAMSIMVVWMRRDSIRRMTRKRVAVRAYVLLGIACAALVAHLFLFQHVVVSTDAWGENATVVYPLWLTGDLKTLAAKSGGRAAALAKYGPRDIGPRIKNAPLFSRAASVILLLGTYSVLVIGIVRAFAELAVRAHERDKVASETLRPNSGETPS